MRTILLVCIYVLAMAGVNAQPKHEVRAVWLTTNGGLDWPKGEYDIETQKSALVDILDKLDAANFNTVIFQAQVKGDVAWQSSMQPAMRYFTGDGAKGLTYDVCEFVIEECHKRNMECHAWVVPYRIGTPTEANRYVDNAVKHPTVSNPELCVLYNNAYYLDPGLPATREYLLDVYKELISNYKFDGINFDYTRYPGSAFDDAASYAAYNPDALPKEDWRRQNINTFIAEFYEMAKSINPDIKIGAAPIGTYKNVPGYGNATAYGSYYQDACQWMQSGNHDLLIPQMYWNESKGFSPNMTTWVNNCDGRQIVVGLAPYKMIDSNNWEISVITDQIEKVRAKDGMSGVCFFRAEHILDFTQTKIEALYSELSNNYFKYPSHIVPMDYNGVTTPNKPENVIQERAGNDYVIKWEEPEKDEFGTDIRYYSIYLSDGSNVDVDDHHQVVAYKVTDTSFTYTSDDSSLRFAVTAFDKNYYESQPAISSISNIEDINAREEKIYYNSDVLTIIGSKSIEKIDIYSITGFCLASIPTTGNEAYINCGSLPNGLYIATVCYADGCRCVNKFMR